MPKRILELTDIQVRNAKPKDQQYKLTDGKHFCQLIKAEIEWNDPKEDPPPVY